MAARQDQSQTIVIIVCSILILLLAIVAYLTWSSSKQEFARAEELATQKQQAENAARQKVQEAESMLAMLGLDAGATFTEVQERYEADKKQFMSTFEEGTQTYRNALDYIYTENAKIAQQENEAKKQVKSLEQQLVAIEAEKQKQIDEAVSAREQAKQDLAAERARFERERESIDRQKRQLAQTLADKETEFNSRVAVAQSARQAAEDSLTKAERSRSTLLAERKQETPSSEVADGAVTYVNQATQTAWIDLGEEDSLRRQVTFSVFDSALTDAAKAEKKGSLEVTRLLGDHIAEAKITNDDPRNPILPGDRIYSQVWQRGKALRFGLTGLIDIDGDGVSDLQRAKDLIALNGAKVDVSLEEDGTVDGEMTVGTRYLVLGDSPDQPSKAAYRTGYQDMSREAANLGVETISLTDFLNRMGYKPVEETVRFSGGSNKGGPAGDAPRSFRFRTP
ncbi:Chromosome partition protein Smc [Botrimarina colliarenosi]|uniref:Chromosome partition protein Smc n=1 Tax=Botrimarina colliarenosi TaxID=2528001 RepID=A0A5C6A4R3_9BACT|nr:hypothetical protein [Botrimarina colliarenosi]TWT93373.1 Chromosome partition protein Smc [Botrimarina colliarenosi]